MLESSSHTEKPKISYFDFPNEKVDKLDEIAVEIYDLSDELDDILFDFEFTK